MAEPTFDHERLDVYRLSIEYVAFLYRVLRVCDAIDGESNIRGKSNLKRIVSMLTRLIQRGQSVAEDAFEYQYEYCGAEYEKQPENRNS